MPTINYYESGPAQMIEDNDFDVDAELLLQFGNGDLEAYEKLMRRHNQRLFRLARSIVKDDDEAVDVVQEAFITAFDRLEDLREPRAFATWVARIAKNRALMFLRENGRYIRMDDEQLENAMESSASLGRHSEPDSDLANRQLGSLLERCIDELPDNFRTVFMLRSVEGCSTRDTADILEIQEATVKTRFHRAKGILQKKITKYSEVAGSSVHEFAGHRCDSIVRNVMKYIRDSLNEQNRT